MINVAATVSDLKNLVLKKTVSLNTTGTVSVPDSTASTEKVKINATNTRSLLESEKLGF